MYSKTGFIICILLFFVSNLHAQDQLGNPLATSELKEVVHLHGEPGHQGQTSPHPGTRAYQRLPGIECGWGSYLGIPAFLGDQLRLLAE